MQEAVAVKDLNPGDRIDLYKDQYADPHGDPLNGFEFELVTVEAVELETADCVKLTTDQDGVFGFPLDHHVMRVSDVI